MNNLTHYDYYLVGKKHQKVVDALITAHDKFWRAARKFKREIGAKDILSRTFGLERTIVGFLFENPPDPKLWRRAHKDDFKNAYLPRKNTTAGKELYRRFKEIREWKSHDLALAVGYQWLHFGDRVFPFNGGFNQKKRIAYFSIPTIPPTTKKPTDWYVPVAGVKKISFKKYQELIK